MVAGLDHRLQWLERDRMPWKRAFMAKGVIIFFAEAVRLKARMLMEVVGERLENKMGERERALREMREEGEEKNTQRIQDSSIIWDELNMSVIPKIQAIIPFMNVSF